MGDSGVRTGGGRQGVQFKSKQDQIIKAMDDTIHTAPEIIKIFWQGLISGFPEAVSHMILVVLKTCNE